MKILIHAIRFKAIEPLGADDLYYMMVLGENDIYTSSYKYSFDRMMQKMGSVPHGDSLLMTLNFDHFKKFIKMAAGYNKLDEFLKTMPAAESETLMQAFVSNLERTGTLGRCCRRSRFLWKYNQSCASTIYVTECRS